MTKINDKLKPIFKEFLPVNAANIIQKNLKNKGLNYSIGYIRENLRPNANSSNNNILNEAVEICTSILDKQLLLIEKKEKLNIS